MFVNSVGKENVLENEPMKNHCSFKTGGNARYFIIPKDAESLIETINIAKLKNIPYYIIGNGSNLLVSDKGINGVVISMLEGFNKIEVNDENITVGAGVSLSRVANAAFENELEGFEFASGIPGSFGGGVFMNAGAYGREIKDVFVRGTVLTSEMEIKTVLADELELKYRKSALEEKGYILINGTICLKNGSKEKIKELMADYNGRRKDKQPLNFPSAGSTFKRPEGDFAGRLIEEAGLKGYTVGGAQVSEKHAGFVINKGDAATGDILSVIEHCKKVIKENYGIELQCEVRMIGEF